MSAESDRNTIRDLAKEYRDICDNPVQEERRALGRRHNSLRLTRPLIYARAFAWHEMPQSACTCRDPLLRHYEDFFRKNISWNNLNDDSIFESWITIQAVTTCRGWGVDVPRTFSDEPGGSFKVDYPLKTLSNIGKLRMPRHEIDEKSTSEAVERLHETVGDIITINLDRGPAYRMWTGDIATDLGYLRGIENFMIDMIDDPERLHRLLAFLRDGILRTHDEAEACGDWGLSAHQNQAMPYAEELQDPAPNVNGIKRKEIWGYMAAQELTAVSPQMHDEFMLQYQLPILKHFGLVAYGCCEDLSQKIDILRQIPNLRRIAVAPFASVPKCAEQIGRDYVISYRPSPTDMVGYGFNPDRIRKILRRDLHACRDLHVDITLKDVETVQSDPERVKKWLAIAREVVNEIF